MNRAEFASIAGEFSSFSGISGSPGKTRTFSKSHSVTSVFLSHAHQDKDVVEQARFFFENLGIAVYVDWADETMPERTNGETATRIKSQIITGTDKFVLLATNTAIASRWCNWEVGIADPFKLSKNKMALLPLADTQGGWNGNEYLQIYPRIERNPRQFGGEGYYIWYPNGDWMTLENWLKV
ncbi:toll/interleukin-1 receptor domain-containing protein [Pedobacter ginsenosidimutans]|nr:toll/interleukin-1 receptor domain-containing protein [Pedobacter ginsenosidimutans]